ncbi:MAG: pyruvate, phosphate dikinase [Proteobacteria bacterium]|nr:pyruvate, phosphate dikinase [Pseudomonadota bacterium]MBU1449842.1 pyruvate, phosphate dikinase [Pseudomonadota bacterium]MBU2467982.1 pyruvate, phosphate dikinase [Pseudomonadota bacterium]MBU2516616.1 pyruvate, phosphate dikinase [Pseudomonadota bacterium]
MVKRLSKFLNRLGRNGNGAPDKTLHGDLKLRFREFKYLLRANNEVLAIIAEIEQQLAEGGQVGLDFLRSRYIAASAKVYKMIRHLNHISGGRYPQLEGAFHRIRADIDQILEEGGGSRSGVIILPLEDLEQGESHLAGSKASNLAELARAGLPVPPGFVVTTEAFRRFMEFSGLGGQLRQAVMILEGSSPEDVETFSHLLEQKVLDAPLPPELEKELMAASQRLGGLGARGLISLRSSAVGEDTQSSFAGLYRSMLGVIPADAAQAFRAVVAALYSPEAVVYRRQRGLLDQDAEMAVLVQAMLEPVASGVMYTTDPLGGGKGPLLISAVRGLGQGLVDGSVDPDLYRLERSHPPLLLDYSSGGQGESLGLGASGLSRHSLDAAGREEPPLSEGQALELARLGLELEERFACPQDVEWALTEPGRLVILQSRPLQVLAARCGEAAAPSVEPLLSGGQTARPGAGAGPAFLVRPGVELKDFPSGGVLVAKSSSPALAAALPRAAALVTDVGGVAGHLASLSREMGVPALVGTGLATKLIAPGQEITVDAGGRRVYPGRVAQLTGPEPSTALCRPRPGPTPYWHQAAGLITKLNLTDPHSPRFTTARCATFHDIIRFGHEMSFKEMFRLGDKVGRDPGGGALRLEARLPFELWFIDLGDGLASGAGPDLKPEQVVSIPGAALLEGLLDPSVDWNRPRPVSLKGLASVFSASLLTPPKDGQVRDMGQRAYAIVSAEYINFNCRVGYHFTALDSFCGAQQNDNYISFRFHGGAATEDRRQLRAELIERLLSDMDFSVERTGDQVSAFIKKYPAGRILELLEELGRLVLFTRQMDMLMSGRPMVDWLAQAFAEKNYNLASNGGEGEPT